MTFLLPDLGYEYDALEPWFDARTMEVHHTQHHAAYLRNFNNAIEEYGLEDKTLSEIFAEVSKYPETVRNNGGGFFNHALFWKILTPGANKIEDKNLADAIAKYFGTLEEMKKEFAEVALNQFGSGWAWLIRKSDGQLLVFSTPNQDNPLMDISLIKGKPLLCIDVWEHAYYLKFQNNRDKYIDAFWNLVNWNQIAELYNKS